LGVDLVELVTAVDCSNGDDCCDDFVFTDACSFALVRDHVVEDLRPLLDVRPHDRLQGQADVLGRLDLLHLVDDTGG